MAQLETWYKQDLKKPLVVHRHADVFNQDSRGNLIGVEIYSDGEPVTLSGSIDGYCLLSDGTTVPAVGANRTGNKASILIPQTAYNVPGPITITIKNTDGNDITTLCAVVGLVRQSVSGNLVQPGDIVTDWSQSINSQLQAVQDAADNVGAIVAVPFAENTAYVVGNYVTYNGNLYRITADHAAGVTWANTKKTQCTVGTELYDLKSAIDVITDNEDGKITDIRTALEYTMPVNLVNPTAITTGKVIDAATGQLNNNDSYKTTAFMECKPGDVLYLTSLTSGGALNGITAVNMFRIAFYDKFYSFLSKENYANSVTVPANAKYFRFSLATSFVSTPSITVNTYPTAPIQFVFYSDPYYKFVQETKEDIAFVQDQADAGVEDIRSALEYTESINLISNDMFTDGKAIDINTGEPYSYEGYKTSGFMECKAGDKVYYTGLTQQGGIMGIDAISLFRIAFYDRYQKYLSYQNNANSISVPANAEYFRITIPSNVTNTPSITLNTYPTLPEQFIQYASPYYKIVQEVKQMVHTTVLILNLNTVDCWGDSMTEGGSTGATYPALLATALGSGFTVNNYGKSSQTSGEVAFRFGTNPVYIKLNGNQIPAAANAVTVDDIICTTGDRYTRRNFGNFASGGYVHCVVEGVPGKLNCLVGVGKSFTRDSAGDAVPTNGYVRVWNDENFSNENICIFWAGKNDTAMADTYIVKGVVDNIYGMTARMQHSQFIVLPVFKSANEGSGTAMYTKITQLNERLATLYPNNFLDIQAMLIEHGLEDAGITPTAEDEAAIASDIVPPSLMAEDGVHPNETCREVYVQYIKNFMIEMGWISAS